MKKMMLVDGNSLLFRGFYATIYTHGMKTSEGVYTNAVYAFANMLNKAIELVQPDTILVAFDSAKKNFRHEMFPEYKGGRKETPHELIGQFAIVREYLDAMNISRFELDGVEADDIIGTLAKRYPDWQINILTSDRDLLQVIDDTTSVWLLKKGISEIEKMTKEALIEKMGIQPLQVIDLKGLSGDASDNIPGIPGVGEKTAMKLLDQFGSVEGVIEHVEELKGKLKEKVSEFAEQALMSKQLATIKVDVEIPMNEVDFEFIPNRNQQIAFFQKYEMNSFVRKLQEASVVGESTSVKKQVIQQVKNCPTHLLQEGAIIAYDVDSDNPYLSNLNGVGVQYGVEQVYLTIEDVLNDQVFLDYLASNTTKVSHDVKMMHHVFVRHQINIEKVSFDTMISAFLCDSALTSFEKLQQAYECDFTLTLQDVYGKPNKPILPELDQQMSYMAQKLHMTSKIYEETKNKLKTLNLEHLFYEVEMPLAKILFKMEYEGISIDQEHLNEISLNMQQKVEDITAQMLIYCSEPINFNSPKQLAVLLFDELGLPANKKRSTSVDILEKLDGKHPIISLLMEYRKYQKLVSTYTEGLKKNIFSDGKIHTIYTQCVTQTGRLSSTAPNLQNISVRDEEGRTVRSAFVAQDGHMLVGADYSQVELRVLAHMAKEEKLVEAFNQDQDIHTLTASELFEVDAQQVSSLQRRQAKAVNFGIVYGISDFGLSEQLQVSRKEAQAFIDKYLATYPNISVYMDKTIAFCEEHGYVETLFHRRREIKEIHDKNYMMREFGKRAAMNAPIQGTAADLIKMAMINIDKKMSELHLESKMLLQVHDELIFHVPNHEKDLMLALVKQEMENVVEFDVVLKVDAQVGKTWYETK